MLNVPYTIYFSFSTSFSRKTIFIYTGLESWLFKLESGEGRILRIDAIYSSVVSLSCTVHYNTHIRLATPELYCCAQAGSLYTTPSAAWLWSWPVHINNGAHRFTACAPEECCWILTCAINDEQGGSACHAKGRPKYGHGAMGSHSARARECGSIELRNSLKVSTCNLHIQTVK